MQLFYLAEEGHGPIHSFIPSVSLQSLDSINEHNARPRWIAGQLKDVGSGLDVYNPAKSQLKHDDILVFVL